MKLPFSSRTKKGMTLVELLVAMTLFSVVIGLTVSVLFNVQKTQRTFGEKYVFIDEADRIAGDIEHSLRLAQKLIMGTYNKVTFLDIDNDTIEYCIKGDTLLKNGNPITDLSVDSLYFGYTKIDGNETIKDFSALDINGNDILDVTELIKVSGIEAYMVFISHRVRRSRKIKMERHFFTRLKNLQSKTAYR